MASKTPSPDRRVSFVQQLNNRVLQPHKLQSLTHWDYTESGPSHAVQWFAKLSISVPDAETVIVTGEDTTKQGAMEKAAEKALKHSIIEVLLLQTAQKKEGKL